MCSIPSAQAETVITSDQIVRGGKVSELKRVVDDAVSKSPGIKRVFVMKRTGGDVPMGKLDIPLEEVRKFQLCLSRVSMETVETK